MITKCLMPVAGYGTRFLPATKAMPKEMLPIVNKPLVQYAVEEAAEAGMDFFCFITGRGKRAIENYFDMSYEIEDQIRGTDKIEKLNTINKLIFDHDFVFIRQKIIKGLGDAILCGRKLINNETFAVILPDDLCVADQEENSGVLQQMISTYHQFACSIVAVQEIPESQTHQYGIIAGDTMEDNLIRVSKMVEKPEPENAPSNLAVIGRYIFTPDLFDILEQTEPGKNNEIQLTDALNVQAANNCVLAYQFTGNRFDCGSIDGFVDATKHIYEKFYKNDH